MQNNLIKIQDGTIYRILQERDSEWLVIDCIKRTMPKWIESLAEFESVPESVLWVTTGIYPTDTNTLSTKEKKYMNEHYISARSHRVSRVPWYSGSCRVSSGFGYGALTLSGRLFQSRSPAVTESLMQSEPRDARITVWALPRSLAATYGIECFFLFLRVLRCFSSPGSPPYVMYWRMDD